MEWGGNIDRIFALLYFLENYGYTVHIDNPEVSHQNQSPKRPRGYIR